MPKLSSLKKILSYFYPVHIGRYSSEQNPVLDLFFYKNKWQLATKDALYSDGDTYRPLVAAFSAIGDDLANVKRMLMLGGGLGSALLILDKMDHHPEVVFVEIDKLVLEHALQLLPASLLKQVVPVCENAKDFMFRDTGKYGLVVADIFLGRVVPEFVRTLGFLEQCRNRLNAGGFFVLNYIEHEAGETEELKSFIGSIFPGYRTIEFGINKVFVATA